MSAKDEVGGHLHRSAAELIAKRRSLGLTAADLPHSPSMYPDALPAADVARGEALHRLRTHFAAHFDVAQADGDHQRVEGAGLALDDIDLLATQLQEAQTTLDKVRRYAEEREAYGKRGRTVHSARIASDLLYILGDGS